MISHSENQERHVAIMKARTSGHADQRKRQALCGRAKPPWVCYKRGRLGRTAVNGQASTSKRRAFIPNTLTYRKKGGGGEGRNKVTKHAQCSTAKPQLLLCRLPHFSSLKIRNAPRVFFHG